MRGRVDWPRRFDHMQQHTGQHILSAALDKLHAARTVGFHLGADVSTVDVDIPLSEEAIAAAESEANRIVWEDRPVRIRFVEEGEAAALPLRKEPERAGTLRVIEVEGYDLSACGGTHVERSGAIGLIAVLSWERLRGGTRLEFACGGRALRAVRRFRDAVAGCIRHVSVAPEELPAAVERLQADAKDQRKIAKALHERLAAFEAAAMAESAETVNRRRQVVQAIEGQDQNGLKAMALAICANPGFQVALFSAALPAVAVVARSRDVPLDAAAVLKALIEDFGGRGGGRPELAQGGGLTGEPAAILRGPGRCWAGSAELPGRSSLRRREGPAPRRRATLQGCLQLFHFSLPVERVQQHADSRCRGPSRRVRSRMSRQADRKEEPCEGPSLSPRRCAWLSP